MTGNGDSHPLRYPCPVCGQPADTGRGCPRCRLPPDPTAAEVILLGAELGVLQVQAHDAWQRYIELARRCDDLDRRRRVLAAQVRTRADAQVGAAGRAPTLESGQPGTPPAGFAGRAEASIPHVLYVLGGLLLISAAVVFTAIAWAAYGVLGRAVILAAVTVLTLSVPPLVPRRRLRGAAETFAVLGLLMLPLDGYAAWYVNLGGVTAAMRPATYAGLVAAATALVAAAYHGWLRLLGPALVGLVMAQPVPALLLTGVVKGSAGWAAVFGATAAGDLALCWRGRRAVAVPGRVLAGIAALVALGAALAAVGTAGGTGAALRGGGILVAVATLSVPAAIRTHRPRFKQVAGGIVAAAVLLAAVRIVAVGSPGLREVLAATVVLLVAALTLVVPAGYRAGTRIVAVAGVGLAAAASLPTVLVSAVRSVQRATAVPAVLPRPGQPVATWQLPVALILLATALVLAWTRRYAVEAAAVAGVAVAFALPGTLATAWWIASTADLIVAVPLAVVTVYPPGTGTAVVRGTAALLAALHAAAAASARPWSTAVVLAAVLLTALVTAALGRQVAAAGADIRDLPAGTRQPSGGRSRPLVVGSIAMAVALLVLPALAGTSARAAGAGAPARWWIAAGLWLAAGAVAALSRYFPEYALAGLAAVAAGALGTALAAVPDRLLGPIAAVALLANLTAGLAVQVVAHRGTPPPPRRVAAWWPPVAALPVLPALAVAVPGAGWVLGASYSWLGAVWAGRPAAPGLTPGEQVGRIAWPWYTVTATIALLAAAAALTAALRRSGQPVRRVYRAAAAAGSVPGVVAVLVGCAAAGVVWPVVPALTLLAGLGAALGVVLRRPRRTSGAFAAFAVLCVGAGTAGSLATPPATVTALAAVLVVAAVCGTAGAARTGRLAGWVAAAIAAGLLAVAAARAAGFSRPVTALCVLAAAAAVLAASTLPIRPGRARTGTGGDRCAEANALEAAAHALALVAVLLAMTDSRYTATVLALWGVATGLRALVPPQAAPVRRARIVAGVGCELLAYWVLIAGARVGVVEAYTVPAAAVALVAGLLAYRSRPALPSWVAYGPALLAGFGPSVATALLVAGDPVRRLVLGVAALVAVVTGAARRLRALLEVGAAVLAVLAVHETVLVWDLLPRWIPLAVGGLLLVGLATTYERRRADLVRLHGAMSRMR